MSEKDLTTGEATVNESSAKSLVFRLKASGISLLTKRPNRVGQPKTLIFGACAIVVMAIAPILLFYGCRKDKVLNDGNKLIKQYVTNGMRVFDGMEDLHAEIDKVIAMDEQELQEYEDEINFLSFGRKAETIYYNIIEPYLDANEGLSAEQADYYISQYPEYLETMTVVFVEGEEEYEFVPKYDGNIFRYIMNENRMFQIQGIVYKVFYNVVIGLPIDEMDILFGITEENVEEEMDNHNFDVLCCDSKIKMTTQKAGTYYYKRYVEAYSSIAANGKERIYAAFQSCSENVWGTSNLIDAYGIMLVRGLWRGCNNCRWMHCRRTLNTNLEMQIKVLTYLVQSGSSKYNTGVPKYKYEKTVVPVERYIWNEPCDYFPHIVHYLQGKIWIATTTLDLDTPEVPIKKGR